MRSRGLVVLLVGGIAATARADAPATALDWFAIPAARTATARVVLEAELRHGHALAPVTLAPDLAVGVDERVGILVHTSHAAESRLGAGNGVCVLPPNETSGPARDSCPHLEPAFGVSALVRFERLETIARVGVLAHDWDPIALAAEVGTTSTIRAGRWYAQLAPTLEVGLTARRDGNRDRVQVPLFAGVSPTPQVELHLRSGVEGAIATFGETYAIPLGAGASVRVRGVRIGADVSLDKALGPLNAMGWRSASLYVQTGFGSW
jgi:hypothetical protein